MATTTTKKRNIKYLNKDFESLKQTFIEHLRIYFPDNVQDFNESSQGMMLLELVAFMGDNLSFYLDRRFNESFIETAREPKNIFKHARQLGFKASGKAPALGKVDAFIKVPAIAQNEEIIPDTRYAGTILKGAQLKSKIGESYETVGDIDFSTVNASNPLFVQVGDVDPLTKVPTSFVLKVEGVDIKAGETKTFTVSVVEHKLFRKIIIPDEDVIEVLSIKDSEGNEWHEVEYLAQDTVFISTPNTSVQTPDVPHLMKLKAAPYRFITEYDVETNKTSCIFGTGDANTFDGELIPDLGDLSLPLFGKDAFTEFSIDPQNFLKSRTMGLSPTNTTLTISYRMGGGLSTNAGSGEVNKVVASSFDVGDSTLSAESIRNVGSSFEAINNSPIQGGRNQLSNREISQLASANFATQGRMVTTSDFIVRTLSMPSKFGSIYRANARSGVINKNSVELVVLSKNSNGHVSLAPSDLKENLKVYLDRFRMMTDAIEILDGEIINIAVEFSILTTPEANKSETISNCIDGLKDFFEIDSWQVNQPINKTDIIAMLAGIPGVLSVINLKFRNRVGTFSSRSYSTTSHLIPENTRNGIIYGKENAIFEVKYPNKDIVGVAK